MTEAERKLRRGNSLLGLCISLLVPVVLLAALALYNALVFPGSGELLGVHFIVVNSGSMEPTIQEGAVILARQYKFDQLKEDDIITFTMEDGQNNTHRVLQVNYNDLRTKGDANDIADSAPVTPENFKYKHVATFNFAARFREEGGWIYFAAAVAALLIVLALIIGLVSHAGHKKRAKLESAQAIPPASPDVQPSQQFPANYAQPVQQPAQYPPPQQYSQPTQYPPQYPQTPVYPQPPMYPTIPNWRDNVFANVDFRGVDFRDPQIHSIDLCRWIRQDFEAQRFPTYDTFYPRGDMR
jgi:signal peptidase I